MAGGLIKITIEQVAVPGYRNLRSAHQPFDGARIKGCDKFVHIFLKIIRLVQPAPESAQGNIGEAEDPIEGNTPFLFQYFPESFLQLLLGRRQESACRVYNQIQVETASASTVPHGI